jgi:hypothetical protein
VIFQTFFDAAATGLNAFTEFLSVFAAHFPRIGGVVIAGAIRGVRTGGNHQNCRCQRNGTDHPFHHFSP